VSRVTRESRPTNEYVAAIAIILRHAVKLSIAIEVDIQLAVILERANKCLTIESFPLIPAGRTSKIWTIIKRIAWWIVVGDLGVALKWDCNLRAIKCGGSRGGTDKNRFF
jgi:hypothetical protein